MMISCRCIYGTNHHHHHGSVLILSLVFVLLLAIVATTVMRTAALQFHMGTNEQLQEEAFQTARSIATELAQNSAGFSLSLAPGRSNCLPGDTHDACDQYSLAPVRFTPLPEGLQPRYRITRREPELITHFPFRRWQGSVSSSEYASAAVFEIDVDIDGRERRLGSARLVRGIALRLTSLP